MYVGWDGCGLIHCPISDMICGLHCSYVCVCSSDDVISLPTALPLTPEKAKYVFENTRNLERLCISFNIPDDKINNGGSASELFIQSTEPMKVRRIILWLEWNQETALADTVMECAEPPAGMYMFMW